MTINNFIDLFLYMMAGVGIYFLLNKISYHRHCNKLSSIFQKYPDKLPYPPTKELQDCIDYFGEDVVLMTYEQFKLHKGDLE